MTNFTEIVLIYDSDFTLLHCRLSGVFANFRKIHWYALIIADINPQSKRNLFLPNFQYLLILCSIEKVLLLNFQEKNQ
jgi:hypothetical protein